MAVSRQATIKIPVKVNQTAIDKANKAITKMTGSGGSLQKAMDKLNGQFDKLDKTINNFSKNYKDGLDGVIESNKQAIKSNKKLTDQTVAGHKQVQKSLQKLADDDKKFTDSSSKHAQQHTRSINGVARSYDHATSRIDRMNKAADKAISVGRSMSLTTLGLGAALAKGSNDAMNLQHQYKVIQNLAVYGGEKQAEAQKNVNEMRKQGEKYSLQYGVSQKKLSAGYEELTRRGYATNQSLATQKQFLQASLASGDDYNDVVHNATSALEAFNMKSDDSAKMSANTKKVLNQMSYAADLTATDFNGLGESMKYVGPSADAANQSIGQTSAALGILSNSGEEASQSGTSLRQILDRLVAPPKKGKAVNAMQQLGLTAQDFRDGKGNLLSLQDIFGKLNDHMKGMNSTNRGAIFNALFGQTAQSAANILSQHVGNLKSLNKQVQNAQNMHGGKGYIAELSAKNMDTAKVQTQKFQAALSDLNITFANELLPNITGLTKGMSNMIAKLADSPSWFKKLVAYGGVFVAGIAPVTLVFGGIAKAIKGVATSLGWVRKQFQTPMSNTMTNSMVRQSEEMQMTGSSGSGAGGSMSRMERNAGKVSRFDKFSSRFGGVARTGTKFGKVGETAMLAKNAGRLGNAGKFLKFAGSGVGAFDVLNSAMDLQGINGKNAGGKIGAAGGSLVGAGAGAALGTAILPGIGTAVGAGVGSMASEWLGRKGGQYLQRKVPKEVNQYKKDFSWTPTDFETHNAGPKIDTRNPFIHRDKNSLSNQRKSAIEKSKEYSTPAGEASRVDQVNKQAFSMSIGNFSKESKKYIQDMFNAENNAFSTYGKNRSQKLSSVYSEANNFANENIGKEQGKMKKMLKAGLITQTQASQASNEFSQRQKQSVANVQNDLSKLNGKEKLSARQRSKIVGDLNSNLVRLTKEGGDKQKGALRALNGATKNLSTKQYLQIVHTSQDAYNKTKQNAINTRKQALKTAKERQSENISMIKSSSLSSSAKKQAIKNANDQYNKSVANANAQYKGVVKNAINQRDDTIQASKEQASGVSQAIKDAGTSVQDQMYALMGVSKSMSNYLPSLDKKTPDVMSGINERNDSLNKLSSGRVKVKSKEEQKKSVNKLGFKSPFSTATFAKGGRISRTQRALVNEHGPESAWNPDKGTFRFLGNGHPTLTKLFAGEHVLTAKQTKQLTHGGMHGHFKAYASGTGANLGNSASTIDFKVANPTALLKFSNKAKGIWNSFRRNTKKNTNQMSNDTADGFSNMKKSATTKTTGLGNVVLNRVTNLRSGLNKLVKGLVSDFNNIFGKLPNYADNSMKGVTNNLNKGIGGINNSLTQFGGNSHVLKPIHYAKGSNGKVPNNHLAVVNDAPTGPRQEAVVRNNKLLYPNGKNAMVALQKGDQVLNGRQTQMIESMNSIAHYAKGSGVSDSTLRDIANKNAKNPGKTWDNSFKVSNNSGSQLQKGLTDDSSKGAKKSGQGWTKAIWDLISNLANGGSGTKSAFLNYAMSHFSGKKYVLGANGPDAYDCSSMVGAALSHFGINIGRTTTAMQGSSQLERIGKSISKTQPGDLALFGHGNGAAGHVGIVNNPNQGTIFNETPPDARTTPLSYITALPLDAFYRVKGLKNTIKSGGNKALNALVKKQLGKRAMKWISSKLAPKFDAGGPAPTGDHSHWLKQAGIPSSWWNGINEIITKESGWNPHAMNPSGAYGLGQALPGSKMASAGSDWKDNPITQLRWTRDYINSRYGGIEQALSFRHAHNWYANGGWANKPGIFGEVPGQPEVAINPKRPSADRLIGEAINARAKADSKSPFARWSSSQKSKKQRDTLIAKRDAIFDKKQVKPVQPNVNMEVNITINGNADQGALQQTTNNFRRIVREEMQKMAFNQLRKG